MLSALLLILLLPFIVSDDFEEITQRNFDAVNSAKDRIEELVRATKEGKTNGRAMFVRCKGIEYLWDFGFLKRYNYLNKIRIINAKLVNQNYNKDKKVTKLLHTTSLYVELRGDRFHLSLQFWQTTSLDAPWELYRVEDLSCGLLRKNYLIEEIEMIQSIYYFKGGSERKRLDSSMFTYNAWFTFCDGSVEKYFFNRNDVLSRDPVILHDLVEFNRDTKRSRLDFRVPIVGWEYWESWTKPIPYFQMDVSFNGRRMQLEYDDDFKMFTKGREFPCAGNEDED